MTTIQQICAHVESMGDVLVLRPGPGDGTPEIAWGDVFFYYAPDGLLPNGQPFATIVTKDYPGEPSSDLGAGVFRVNVDVGRRDQPECEDPAVRDEVLPHPVYGNQGWVCVVQHDLRASDDMLDLLGDAYSAARRRWSRRRE